MNKYPNHKVDGILYDLGTCSTHFDDASRGFSFRHNGPLDMRFDTKKGKPLADWINKATENDIKEVLYKYGDEKHAKLISRNIVEYRNQNTLDSTLQLANLIQDIYPDKKNKIHPATKTFQALRIYINDELNELKLALQKSENLLAPNGLLIIVSFQSLEDRIVKDFFNHKSGKRWRSSRHLPDLGDLGPITLKIITKKPLRPKDFEINNNPRSRSAKLRVAQKI